jgi:hypothetical protein
VGGYGSIAFVTGRVGGPLLYGDIVVGIMSVFVGIIVLAAVLVVVTPEEFGGSCDGVVVNVNFGLLLDTAAPITEKGDGDLLA